MGNDDLMSSYDKDRSDPTRKKIPHGDNMPRVCNLKLQDLNKLSKLELILIIERFINSI